MSYDQSRRRILSIVVVLVIGIAVFGRALPPMRFFELNLFTIYSYFVFTIATVGFLLVYRRKFPLNRPLIFLGFFTGYSLISIVWATDGFEALRGGFFITTSFLLIVVVYTFTDSLSQFRDYFDFIYVVVFVLLVIAVWEVFTHQYLPVSRYSGQVVGDRPPATTIYFNPNNFSLVLAMAFPLVLFKLRQGVRKRLALPLWGIIIVILTVVYLNHARAALLSVAGSGITIVVLNHYRFTLDNKVGHLRRLPTMFLILFISSIILAPVIVPNPFTSTGSQSLWIRWEIMDAGTQFLVQHPFGGGIKNTSNTIGASPHNWVVQLSVDMGLPGLFLFILILGNTLDGLLQIYLETGSYLPGALFASLLWFTIGGMGPSDVLLQVRFFWIILGLGIAYYTVAELSSTTNDGETTS